MLLDDCRALSIIEFIVVCIVHHFAHRWLEVLNLEFTIYFVIGMNPSLVIYVLVVNWCLAPVCFFEDSEQSVEMNFFNKHFFPHFGVGNLFADSNEIDWPVKHTILKTVLVFTNICYLKSIFETLNVDGLCGESPPTAHLVHWLVERFTIIRVHAIVHLGCSFFPFYLFHWHLTNFTRSISCHLSLFMYHTLWGCRSCDYAIMVELALGLGSSAHSIVIIRFILRTRVDISHNTSLCSWSNLARMFWTLVITPETATLSINWRLNVCNGIFIYASRTRRSKGLSLTHSVVHINPLRFTLFQCSTIINPLFLHALFTMW